MKKSKAKTSEVIIMTAAQYAHKRGVTLAAVCEMLRKTVGDCALYVVDSKNNSLPGVEVIERWGRNWRLTVKSSAIKKGRVKKYTKVS